MKDSSIKRKLIKAGWTISVDEKTSQRIATHPDYDSVIEWFLNGDGSSGDAVCLRTRGIKDHDDSMTDYCAGSFSSTISGAIDMAERRKPPPPTAVATPLPEGRLEAIVGAAWFALQKERYADAVGHFTKAANLARQRNMAILARHFVDSANRAEAMAAGVRSVDKAQVLALHEEGEGNCDTAAIHYESAMKIAGKAGLPEISERMGVARDGMLVLVEGGMA